MRFVCIVISSRRSRIAVKMRKPGFPECHREFMDFMAALQFNDFEDQTPPVQAALKVLEKCYEEKNVRNRLLLDERRRPQAKKKLPASSINYHLARHTKKHS